jgi:hypothetical protein
MSIIFDALKRAESQRNKGQLPTLGSQSEHYSTATDLRAGRRLWMLLSVFVLSGLGAWWFSAQPHAADETLAAAGTTQTAASPQSAVKPANSANSAEPSSSEVTAALAEVANNPPPPVSMTDLTQRGSDASEAYAGAPGNAARTGQTSRVSMPSLDRPMTGAARFAAAPTVEPSKPATEALNSASAKPTSAQNEGKAPTSAATTPVVSTTAEAPPAPTQGFAAPGASNTQMVPIKADATPVAQVLPEGGTAGNVSAQGLPSVFELEYKVRYELPKMNVSMYVYNAQAAYRFVIIGGKRYREGEQVEAKVTVSQIRSDGLECDYQGTRFFYPRQAL